MNMNSVQAYGMKHYHTKDCKSLAKFREQVPVKNLIFVVVFEIRIQHLTKTVLS